MCLSLLGTWHGQAWIPGTSTLLQVLVSIQALILVPEPYFNEPAFAPLRGTVRGAYRSRTFARNGGYEAIREKTVQWAMLDMLDHPPPGFEDVVAAHFYLRAKGIRARVAAWK